MTITAERTETKTNGQQFADALRKVMHIGPRTRQRRKHPLGVSSKQDVTAEALEAVENAHIYPGYYSEPTSRALAYGWSAVTSWNKHVEGYRIDSTQRAYLTSLSPWQFTALLGEMVDAGISNVGEGERWFAARRSADVAAWNSR
jgi:hypothetical protein